MRPPPPAATCPPPWSCSPGGASRGGDLILEGPWRDFAFYPSEYVFRESWCIL